MLHYGDINAKSRVIPHPPKESDSIKDGIWLRSEVLVTQLCLTLCNAMNCSPPGSSVPWILQARILEWVDIPFFRGSSWSSDQTQVSCIAVRFFTIWAIRVAHQVHEITHILKLQRLGIEELKFTFSRTKIEDYRGSVNLPTHLSETSSHLPSLGALPPHSPESQEEPQSLVPLHHHRNPHQGQQSSDLALLRAEQGSDETTIRGLVWEIPRILLTQSFWAARGTSHSLF